MLVVADIKVDCENLRQVVHGTLIIITHNTGVCLYSIVCEVA